MIIEISQLAIICEHRGSGTMCILLPQMAEKAYRELVRLGMSDGEGYSLKTFMKYYRK